MLKRLPSVATTFVVVTLAISCTDRVQQLPVPTEPLIGRGGPGVKSVIVTPSSASIAVNGGLQLTATAAPSEAATAFTWTSSNTAIATVSPSGVVTGVSGGTATIGATASGGTATATAKVRVSTGLTP